MAQYKVPQNVEAEDKILGPLSLRQFIYVIIALMWAFLMWRIFIHAIPVAVLLALPVSGVFLALGLIQREEQSFENYFIAMIRFMMVPRFRVWHKDDVAGILKAPEPVKKPTPAMQQNPQQVRGQLEKLALIVDTRGRAAKPDSIQLPDANNQAAALSARVNVPTAAEQEILQARVNPEDDILDMQNNQQAVNVGHLLENVEANIRQEALAKMQQAGRSPAAVAPTPQAPPRQAQAQNDILDLALNSGGLSVAQIGRSANRASDELTENQAVSLR